MQAKIKELSEVISLGCEKKCLCATYYAVKDMTDLQEYSSHLIVFEPTSEELWVSGIKTFDVFANSARESIEHAAKACQLDLDSVVQKIKTAQKAIHERNVHKAGDEVVDALIDLKNKVCEA